MNAEKSGMKRRVIADMKPHHILLIPIASLLIIGIASLIIKPIHSEEIPAAEAADIAYETPVIVDEPITVPLVESVEIVEVEESPNNFIPLDCELDEETQRYIYYLAEGNGIDFALVMGLIQLESSFEPELVSETSDYGLMQINACNHEWLKDELGITDFLDPTQNIQAGIHILSNLFEKYDDPAKVLMAYNLGEAGAKRLWDKGIYRTRYTDKVMGYAEALERR